MCYFNIIIIINKLLHALKVQLLLICCWYWTFISDLYVKKASSMLDDILRFEKTIISQEQQIL